MAYQRCCVRADCGDWTGGVDSAEGSDRDVGLDRTRQSDLYVASSVGAIERSPEDKGSEVAVDFVAGHAPFRWQRCIDRSITDRDKGQGNVIVLDAVGKGDVKVGVSARRRSDVDRCDFGAAVSNSNELRALGYLAGVIYNSKGDFVSLICGKTLSNGSTTRLLTVAEVPGVRGNRAIVEAVGSIEVA